MLLNLNRVLSRTNLVLGVFEGNRTRCTRSPAVKRGYKDAGTL